MHDILPMLIDIFANGGARWTMHIAHVSCHNFGSKNFRNESWVSHCKIRSFWNHWKLSLDSAMNVLVVRYTLNWEFDIFSSGILGNLLCRKTRHPEWTLIWFQNLQILLIAIATCWQYKFRPLIDSCNTTRHHNSASGQIGTYFYFSRKRTNSHFRVFATVSVWSDRLSTH